MYGVGVSCSTFGQRVLSLCLSNCSCRYRKNIMPMYILEGSPLGMVLGFRPVLLGRGFCDFVLAIAVAGVERIQCICIFWTEFTFVWFWGFVQYFRTAVSVSCLRSTETSVQKSCTKLHLCTRNVSILSCYWKKICSQNPSFLPTIVSRSVGWLVGWSLGRTLACRVPRNRRFIPGQIMMPL